jgi:hypothetical protein
MGRAMDQQIRLGKILVYLFINRLVLLAVTYWFYIPKTGFINFLEVFGRRWDGNSYVFLAQHWYVTSGSERFFIVFPPVYPLLVQLTNLLANNYILAGVIVSNVAFMIALTLLYRLVSNRYSNKIGLISVILISVFPTSYFYSICYPESLFILFFTLSFYFLSKNYYLLSATMALLATLTRPFGVFLWPALATEILVNHNNKIRKLIIFVIFGFIAIFTYLALNRFIFGNPWQFQLFLKEHWQKEFAFFGQGILDSWKRGGSIIGWPEALPSTIAILFIPLAFLKKFKLRLPELIYYISCVIFFTSTRFVLSSPRYLLSIPPFFIILAKILRWSKPLYYLTIGIFTVVLIYCSKSIALGQWMF